MKRVTEYEVWSKPGGALPADFGQAIQGDVWACGIPRDVFLGVSNIPDASDVSRLDQLLRRSPAEASRFLAFCATNALDSARGSAHSAARYMAFVEGCCVAWVHIPRGPGADELMRKIETAIDRFDLIVRPT